MIPHWPHGDPREVARAVLSDRRFHAAPNGPAAKTWLDLVWDAVRALWERIVGPLGRLVGNDAVTNTIGALVLVAAAVFLIVVLVRFAEGYRRTHAARRAPGESTPLDGDAAGARALRARAAAAAAQGRYHDAAALLWLSVLHALDERGRVRYDAARTPGEWRRIVRDPDFDALARDAVVALFASRAADRELIDRMDAAYDRLVPA